MVSLPSYNDQLFADGISETDFQALLTNPDQPLLNKAIGAQYAPGSTFKLVTGTAGLETDAPAPVRRPVHDRHSTTASPALHPDRGISGTGSGTSGLGPAEHLPRESPTRATRSSTSWPRLVGVDDLTYWADQYGFGKPTGIDLPETATGIVPTNAWKLANQGDADVHRRDHAGRHRPGLRRRDAASAPERLLRSRQRRQPVAAAGREVDHGRRNGERSDIQSSPTAAEQAAGLAADARRPCAWPPARS